MLRVGELFEMPVKLSKVIRTLIIAICLGVVSQSYGAQPRITKSSLSNLLQQPTVSAIYRDKSGILWVGTQQGLHRFDGANLTVFNSDSSNKNRIPESEIKDIAEDNDGNILVATSSGVLLKLNPRTEAFDAVLNFGLVDKTNLIRLLVSKHGSIWLLSKDQLLLYNAKFQSTDDWVMQLNELNKIGVLHDIVEDESGNLWVGGSLGMAKILPQEKSVVSFDLETMQLSTSSRLTALEINSKGNLVVGTDTGRLLVWDIIASRPLAHAVIAGNSANYISDFVMRGEMLIIATDRGLFSSDIYLSQIRELGDLGDGLSNPDIYSLFLDGKYIWVGTINGLDILSFAPFELFNRKNSGVFNTVQAFEEDDDGRIWVGTYSGLFLYEDVTRSHARYSYSVESDSPVLGDEGIATIANGGNGLWLGYFQSGVKRLDLVRDRFYTPKMKNGYKLAITKILASKQNKDVWIATYENGLFRTNAESTYSYYENKSLPDKTITLLFQSNTGVLAVSENRIYRHNPLTDQFSQIKFDFHLGKKHPVIYSLAQADNDDILVGTKDHGLYIWPHENQLKNNFLLQPVKESGLTTSTIYGMELDAKRNLWCSTQNGIVKLDSRGHLIKIFTTADGLQGNDFTLGASFTSREGFIYFGGVNGYNRFDPNEVDIDSTPSPMRLTGISLPKLDDRNLGAVNAIKSLQLTHRDHFITFQFSVLDFIAPERNLFRYKLENFDPDWIENGTRNTATYTNLPAGDYVLRVQGANSAGIWNRDGLSLKVRVLPPPWFTWWAYSIYCVALLLLVWVSHRIYRSYAIDRKSAQLATQMFEAASKADDDMQEQFELQDELIQSAFEHNRTTLSLISDFITHRSSNQADQVVRDFTDSSVKRIAALSILEDCLYYQGGESVANLNKYVENIIPELLKSSPVKSETVITINEITSTLIPAQLATPLSMVIFELVENCLQHAFDLNSPANYLHLKLGPDPKADAAASSYELSIHDSGVGLPDTIENLALESSGIAIVQSIVKQLGGTLQCSDTSGTTISITFPNPG